MAPPAVQPESPTTPRPDSRTTNPVEQGAPGANNALGLTIQPDAPAPSTKKKSVFDRLEEAANNAPTSARSTARIAIDKYSLGPMPLISDASPTSIFENIHLATVREWDLLPGGKLIAIPFDTDARAPETHEFIRTRILTAVAEITSAQEISVAAPKLSEEAANKGRSPTSFLIYNISLDQVDTLLKRKVWSSRSITFRAAPFETMCPSFLFTIKDFATTQLKDVFVMVRRVWDSQGTKKFVDDLLNDVPAEERGRANLEIEQVLTSMNIARLDIKEAGNNLHPHFNIYANCDNFTDEKKWSELRSHLFTSAYISPIQGQATTVKIPFRCSCCHGVDHPRGLCPFPNLPGWNGPKRDQGGDPNQRRNGGSPYMDKRNQRQRFPTRT